MTYHEVEKNHKVDHLSDVPDFKARKPLIHVSIVKEKNGEYKTDWDVQSCLSFTEEYGKWSRCKPGLELPT
mgnify:CR=1 FL=1